MTCVSLILDNFVKLFTVRMMPFSKSHNLICKGRYNMYTDLINILQNVTIIFLYLLIGGVL